VFYDRQTRYDCYNSCDVGIFVRNIKGIYFFYVCFSNWCVNILLLVSRWNIEHYKYLLDEQRKVILVILLLNHRKRTDSNTGFPQILPDLVLEEVVGEVSYAKE
jgi:hypothetical protein